MARTRKSEESITAKRRLLIPAENHVDTNNDERREYNSKLMPQNVLATGKKSLPVDSSLPIIEPVLYWLTFAPNKIRTLDYQLPKAQFELLLVILKMWK
ncbi:hypothetical protein M2G98_12210 [Vibrio vulnificus]|nr:hypothetical protein [Vibrio vulnificus]MCU8486137.1 hypothetical protein [Vibrio vulnificus]